MDLDLRHEEHVLLVLPVDQDVVQQIAVPGIGRRHEAIFGLHDVRLLAEVLVDRFHLLDRLAGDAAAQHIPQPRLRRARQASQVLLPRLLVGAVAGFQFHDLCVHVVQPFDLVDDFIQQVAQALLDLVGGLVDFAEIARDLALRILLLVLRLVRAILLQQPSRMIGHLNLLQASLRVDAFHALLHLALHVHEVAQALEELFLFGKQQRAVLLLVFFVVVIGATCTRRGSGSRSSTPRLVFFIIIVILLIVRIHFALHQVVFQRRQLVVDFGILHFRFFVDFGFLLGRFFFGLFLGFLLRRLVLYLLLHLALIFDGTDVHGRSLAVAVTHGRRMD
mmetsp:Transcript_9469/g.26989  ORF Transcript_9469/g.26989 Transcript_9469/m.26989 type:complete len:334 (+) Transcript_9469:1308-2309(+)